METVKPNIFYTVDEEGTILDIGGDWQAFVDKGGLEDPQAMADYNMVGKNLFDFIANETVRDMYQSCIAKQWMARSVNLNTAATDQTWQELRSWNSRPEN